MSGLVFWMLPAPLISLFLDNTEAKAADVIAYAVMLILPDYTTVLKIDGEFMNEKQVGVYLLGPLGLAIGLGSVLAGLISGDRIQPRLVPIGAIGLTVSFFLLGTDRLGRDVLSRIIHATRVDLPLAVTVVVLSAAVGAVVGAIAAYRGGFVDSLLNGLGSLVQAFPVYVLLIAVVFALGPGARSLVVGYVIIIVVVVIIGLLAGVGLLLRGGSESELVEGMMVGGGSMPLVESDPGHGPEMDPQGMGPGQEVWAAQPAYVQETGGWPDRDQVGELDQDGWEWLEFPPDSGTWYYRDPASGDWWLP